MKIALIGRMRSGKDTVGRYLVNRYGFTRYALGDGVRFLCKILYPDIVVQGKPRYLYQTVGQAMREIDPDVWIKYMSRNIERDNLENIVVTDVRQPNEFDTLRQAGFYMVRVNARHLTRINRLGACGDAFTKAEMNHETESYVDSFAVDYELYNDGNLDDLYQQTEQLLRGG